MIETFINLSIIAYFCFISLILNSGIEERIGQRNVRLGMGLLP
jgi:hypothetical protein